MNWPTGQDGRTTRRRDRDYFTRGRGGSGCGGRPARLETFAAKDGAALRGAERNGGLFSASGASGLGFNLRVAVGLSGCRGRAEDGDPLGLTSFATLGFVLKLLVVKKKLFPGSEDEITPTVDTFQHLVLKFH